MKVFVITKHYDYYEESSTEVIGVRETKSEAEALIAKDRRSNDHPLCTADDWYRAQEAFLSQVMNLMRDEKNSMKKGGWIKKYKREQLSKEDRHVYDRLVDASGEMSFPEFWKAAGEDAEYMGLLEDFFHPALHRLSPEKRSELKKFFSAPRDLKHFTYSINVYETKPSFKIEPQE